VPFSAMPLLPSQIGSYREEESARLPTHAQVKERDSVFPGGHARGVWPV
jgi:hypothetical protein